MTSPSERLRAHWIPRFDHPGQTADRFNVFMKIRTILRFETREEALSVSAKCANLSHSWVPFTVKPAEFGQWHFLGKYAAACPLVKNCTQNPICDYY